MVQPRRASAWLLLCVLACLFVLSMASPRLWDHAARSAAKPDSLPAGQQHLASRRWPADGICRQPAARVARGQQRSVERASPLALRLPPCLPPLRSTRFETKTKPNRVAPWKGPIRSVCPRARQYFCCPSQRRTAVGPAEAGVAAPEFFHGEPPHCDGGRQGAARIRKASVTPAGKIGAQTTVAEDEREGCGTRELPAAGAVGIGSPSAGGRGQHSITGPCDPARRRATAEKWPLRGRESTAIPLPAAGISAPACRA